MDDIKPVILVVDDEQFNLDIITDYLSDMNVDVICVDNGEKALSMLQQTPDRFSAVLLDRMMPGMDGMEVLINVKNDKNINRLPIIMQTAKADKKSMFEGLNAGAHYYLSKPYDQKTLIAIVTSAVRDYQHYLLLRNNLKKSTQALKMMDQGSFTFQSLDDGRNLASMLANACPDSERLVLGLTELITNAIEHGNLGISYKEKSKLNSEGNWENEINKRLSLPMYKERVATVEFTRGRREITFVISDQGDGFDWHKYMEICPERAFDSHGRGIALAKSLSFNEIQYLNNGSQVRITVPLQ
ncbi:MAG: response regulator [Gammaproteobacteria bacterium]|nr:response regulator [Gammaproteobacteria bacterium]